MSGGPPLEAGDVVLVEFLGSCFGIFKRRGQGRVGNRDDPPAIRASSGLGAIDRPDLQATAAGAGEADETVARRGVGPIRTAHPDSSPTALADDPLVIVGEFQNLAASASNLSHVFIPTRWFMLSGGQGFRRALPKFAALIAPQIKT